MKIPDGNTQVKRQPKQMFGYLVHRYFTHPCYY